MKQNKNLGRRAFLNRSTGLAVGAAGLHARRAVCLMLLCFGLVAFLGPGAAVVYALHASRGPTLVFNGLEDTVVAIPTHREPFFRDLRDRTVLLRATDQGIFEAGFVLRHQSVQGGKHERLLVSHLARVTAWYHLDGMWLRCGR